MVQVNSYQLILETLSHDKGSKYAAHVTNAFLILDIIANLLANRSENVPPNALIINTTATLVDTYLALIADHYKKPMVEVLRDLEGFRNARP